MAKAKTKKPKKTAPKSKTKPKTEPKGSLTPAQKLFKIGAERLAQDSTVLNQHLDTLTKSIAAVAKKPNLEVTMKYSDPSVMFTCLKMCEQVLKGKGVMFAVTGVGETEPISLRLVNGSSLQFVWDTGKQG